MVAAMVRVADMAGLPVTPVLVVAEHTPLAVTHFPELAAVVALRPVLIHAVAPSVLQTPAGSGRGTSIVAAIAVSAFACVPAVFEITASDSAVDGVTDIPTSAAELILIGGIPLLIMTTISRIRLASQMR
jgi:hypothetical protein